jgi:hypothetical protein
MDLNNHIKTLQQIIIGLKKLDNSKKPLPPGQRFTVLQKLIIAINSLELNDLVALFEKERIELKAQINEAMEKRRENLLSAARAIGVFHKRFGEYDRVGLFKVSYKGKKVKLEIGSELVREFEEVEGDIIFQAIQHQAAIMEQEPFAREIFFRTISDAIRLAKERKQYRDGWVPIKIVYLYLGLLRNLEFEEFNKNPSSKSYHNYPKSQFVYDMARFGKIGWSMESENLRSMPPNMATVAAGKSMTLPDLVNLGSLGPQIASLRIDRQGDFY